MGPTERDLLVTALQQLVGPLETIRVAAHGPDGIEFTEPDGTTLCMTASSDLAVGFVGGWIACGRHMLQEELEAFRRSR